MLPLLPSQLPWSKLMNKEFAIPSASSPERSIRHKESIPFQSKKASV
jgi:hypothetical protein